jgi:hypothetical protein
MSWIAETPQCVVQAHLDMLERLMAEEAMQRSTETSLGSRLKSDAKTWNAWSRAAEGPRRAPARKGPPNPAALAAMGIGFKKVKRG